MNPSPQLPDPKASQAIPKRLNVPTMGMYSALSDMYCPIFDIHPLMVPHALALLNAPPSLKAPCFSKNAFNTSTPIDNIGPTNGTKLANPLTISSNPGIILPAENSLIAKPKLINPPIYGIFFKADSANFLRNVFPNNFNPPIKPTFPNTFIASPANPTFANNDAINVGIAAPINATPPTRGNKKSNKLNPFFFPVSGAASLGFVCFSNFDINVFGASSGVCFF